jgi:predicted nucleotidyltransferase
VQLCDIKKIILILTFLAVQFGSTFAADTNGLCMISITDSNNERIAGASIELAGVNKTFYTNVNGFCYIPKNLLSKTGRITVNSISYKTVYLNTDNLGSKIVLESR